MAETKDFSGKVNIDQELLAILCCPETKQDVVLANDALIARLNDRIAKRELKNKAGQPVSEKLDGGLIRADKGGHPGDADRGRDSDRGSRLISSTQPVVLPPLSRATPGLWSHEPHVSHASSPRSERDRSERRSRDEEANLGLVLVGLGASGSAALRAEVFVEVAGWEDEKQTLSGGRGLTARRTVEQRGAKRPVLVAGRLAPLLPRRRAAGPNRAPGTRRSGPRAETRALGTGRTHEAILSKSVSRGQAGEKVLAPSPGLVL